MMEVPRSEWIYAGTPKMANRKQRNCVYVVEVTPELGKTKGNREYS